MNVAQAYLILIVVGVLLIFLYSYLMNKVNDLKNKNKNLQNQSNEQSILIREANIKNVPPKEVEEE